MVVSLKYCSQNGGNLFRAPYYNGNPNIGPRIIGNLDKSPYAYLAQPGKFEGSGFYPQPKRHQKRAPHFQTPQELTPSSRV